MVCLKIGGYDHCSTGTRRVLRASALRHTERHGAIALILFFDEQKQATAVAQFVGLLAGFAGTASSGEGLRRGKWCPGEIPPLGV